MTDISRRSLLLRAISGDQTLLAQLDNVDPGIQGEDWVDDSDPALSYEEKRDIKSEERRIRQERRERAYKQRLDDLGIGKNKGGSSGGSSSSNDSDGDSQNQDGDGDSDSGQSAGAEVSGNFAEPMKDAVDNISSAYKTPERPGHRGIDIAKPQGEEIYAVTDGVVAQAGPASGFGNWIVLDHDVDGKMYSSVYGHMYAQDLKVSAGDEVKAGDHIANEGSDGESTGPHLHFEVWEGGRLTGGTEIDPTEWAKRGKK